MSNLQLAVFGEEVISQEYCSKAGQSAARAKLQALKGARTLTLQQQYGLVLATFDSPPEGALPAPDLPPGTTAVYVINFEMDGVPRPSRFPRGCTRALMGARLCPWSSSPLVEPAICQACPLSSRT